MKYKPPQPQPYSAETAALLTRLKDRTKRLEEALELLLCGAEKVQNNGYAFAKLDQCVVMARAALAKAKEAKP